MKLKKGLVKERGEIEQKIAELEQSIFPTTNLIDELRKELWGLEEEGERMKLSGLLFRCFSYNNGQQFAAVLKLERDGKFFKVAGIHYDFRVGYNINISHGGNIAGFHYHPDCEEIPADEFEGVIAAKMQKRFEKWGKNE